MNSFYNAMREVDVYDLETNSIKRKTMTFAESFSLLTHTNIFCDKTEAEQWVAISIDDYNKLISTYPCDSSGFQFEPWKIEHYQICEVCGGYVRKNALICWQCPRCIISDSDFCFGLSFGNSKSDNYKSAMRRAKSFKEYYQYIDGYHTLWSAGVEKYYECSSKTCENRFHVENN